MLRAIASRLMMGRSLPAASSVSLPPATRGLTLPPLSTPGLQQVLGTPMPAPAMIMPWTSVVLGETPEALEASSVLKKRRKAMRKHKLRKLRKRTRFERRRLGK